MALLRKNIKQSLVFSLFIFQFLSPVMSKEDGFKILSSEVLKNLAIDSIKKTATYYSTINLDYALFCIDIAIEKSKNANNLKQNFDSHFIKGSIYEENQSLDLAIHEYLISEEMSHQLSHSQKTSINTYLAIAYRKNGQYKLAQERHLKVLQIALEANDVEAIQDSYLGLGSLFSMADDFDGAVNNYIKSLEFAERRKDAYSIIISLSNLSDCYNRMKDFKQAQNNIERAYEMALQQPDKELLIDVIEMYGGILSDTKQFEKALKILEDGLSICKQNPKLIVKKYKILIAKGNLFIHQEKFEEAEVLFNECLKKQNLLENYTICELYHQAGNISVFQKKYSAALLSFKNSLKISEKLDFILLSEANHRKMYEIFKIQNNFPQSLLHLEIANQLQDSIFNQEKTKRVSELQFRYQLEKSEKEIQSLRLRENNFLLYASLGIFGVALAFMLYIIKIRGKTFKELQVKTDEIELKNKKLEETNQVLHQFAYASAHDLKEPLRTIGSFVSLTQRRYGKYLPEEAMEYMNYVTGGVKKMNNLLEDLLQYSTLTMNGKEVLKEDVQLDEIVREITENLQNSIKSKDAIVEFPQKMAAVYMSRLHTTQLMQNLISNALKFVIEKPRIKISSEESPEAVLITVEDNGIGIKQEYGDKIFNLFQRLNKNDIRYEGTGLGLAICKNIVDKYNGKIWFESVENQGTKFFINIPKTAA